MNFKIMYGIIFGFLLLILIQSSNSNTQPPSFLFVPSPIRNGFIQITDCIEQIGLRLIPKDYRTPGEIERSIEYQNKRKKLHEGIAKFRSSVLKANMSKRKKEIDTLEFEIRRFNVFNDSHLYIMQYETNYNFYKKLKVHFYGEEGDDDQGGLTKEWLTVLSEEAFSPKYGLFIYNTENGAEINPLSSMLSEHYLSYYEFIGRITAMAVINRSPLNASLSRAFLKGILNQPMQLQDVEYCDPAFYRSLKWVKENDITGMGFTFTDEFNFAGKIENYELRPNGANVEVKESNKISYVRSKISFKYKMLVQEQMNAFLEGFKFVLPLKYLKPFSVRELDVLLCGVQQINVDRWKAHTSYFNCDRQTNEVKWFWKALRSFNNDDRVKFLQYTCSVSRVPDGGFENLKFKINRYNPNKDGLPEAHTCTNTIDLPEYTSYEKLRQQLLEFINYPLNFSKSK